VDLSTGQTPREHSGTYNASLPSASALPQYFHTPSRGYWGIGWAGNLGYRDGGIFGMVRVSGEVTPIFHPCGDALFRSLVRIQRCGINLHLGL